MNTRTIAIAFSVCVAPLHAGPRSSANYNIASDSADATGRRSTSASYTNDGSAGGITGISSVASPAETLKAGYIGQLYDATGLTLTSPGTSVNETAAIQLAARLMLDDATALAVPATDVTWSVQSGPLTGISASGLATADAVYQNTSAVAQGVHLPFTGVLGLTVVNTLPDNFGSYAADSIADDWQAQYFGLNNPSAAPLLDPDSDGFDNLFEYRAGIIPTDAASVFHWRMEAVPGEPGQRRIVFSPRLPGGTYTVQTSTDLLSSHWISLSDGVVSDNGDERTVTDPNAGTARKFYRVDITRP